MWLNLEFANVAFPLLRKTDETQLFVYLELHAILLAYLWDLDDVVPLLFVLLLDLVEEVVLAHVLHVKSMVLFIELFLFLLVAFSCH